MRRGDLARVARMERILVLGLPFPIVTRGTRPGVAQSALPRRAKKSFTRGRRTGLHKDGALLGRVLLRDGCVGQGVFRGHAQTPYRVHDFSRQRKSPFALVNRPLRLF